MANKVSLSVSSTPISTPAIILDSNQKPHVVWEASGEIYYRNKAGSSWSSTENLSTNNNTALNPTIVSYSTTIYAAWQENVSGNNEIYYKVRTGSSWGYYTNASQTSGSSVNPVLGGPLLSTPVIMWSDNTGGNWDIKWIWLGGGGVNTLASTSGVSSYPSFGFKLIPPTNTSAKLYAIWTEGSSAPYQIPPVTHEFQLYPSKYPVAWESVTLPATLSIQNYPNPFNPKTTLTYDIPDDGFVSLRVFDLLGREVAKVVEEYHIAGSYSRDFDGRDLAGGVYLYRLTHSGQNQVGKMLIVK